MWEPNVGPRATREPVPEDGNRRKGGRTGAPPAEPGDAGGCGGMRAMRARPSADPRTAAALPARVPLRAVRVLRLGPRLPRASHDSHGGARAAEAAPPPADGRWDRPAPAHPPRLRCCGRGCPRLPGHCSALNDANYHPCHRTSFSRGFLRQPGLPRPSEPFWSRAGGGARSPRTLKASRSPAFPSPGPALGRWHRGSWSKFSFSSPTALGLGCP